MNAHVQYLIDEVRRLSEVDRLEFFDAIADAELDDDSELNDLIVRRIQEIESGQVKGISWEEAKARARRTAHEPPAN